MYIAKIEIRVVKGSLLKLQGNYCMLAHYESSHSFYYTERTIQKIYTHCTHLQKSTNNMPRQQSKVYPAAAKTTIAAKIKLAREIVLFVCWLSLSVLYNKQQQSMQKHTKDM